MSGTRMMRPTHAIAARTSLLNRSAWTTATVAATTTSADPARTKCDATHSIIGDKHQE